MEASLNDGLDPILHVGQHLSTGSVEVTLQMRQKCIQCQRRETASGKKYKTKSDKADENRILLNNSGKIKTDANFRLKSLHQVRIKTE